MELFLKISPYASVFFNLLYSDAGLVPDEEGLDLEGDASAKRAALLSLRDLIAEEIADALKPVRIKVEIVREDQKVIGTVTAEVEVPELPSQEIH